MARKKTKIQQEWDAALTKLNQAITALETKTGNGSVTADDITEVDTKYAAWKKLLDESVEKVAAWKKEKDPERLKWMTFVNTQKTKTGPNFVTKIAKVKGEAETVIGGNKARAELIDNLDNSAIFNLNRADAALKAAEKAVEGAKLAEAIRQHGIGLNALKASGALATKSGLTKQANTYAKKYGVTVKDVDLAHSTVTTKFTLIQRRQGELSTTAGSLDDAIANLTEQAANGDPETTSTDPEYKRKLKQSQTQYKSVVDFAKSGLAKEKTFAADVRKLETILGRTTAGNAVALVPAVVKLFGAIKGEYKKVDTHIQQMIRESTSTYAKQATDWGITTEDKGKTLATLMNRAFAINYQCKAVLSESTEQLRDILETLVEKFDTPTAKTALDTVKMGRE